MIDIDNPVDAHKRLFRSSEIEWSISGKQRATTRQRGNLSVRDRTIPRGVSVEATSVWERGWQLKGWGKVNWGATFEGKPFRPGVIAGLKSPPYITLFCFFLQYPHYGQPVCRPWETTSSSLQMSLSPLWQGFQSTRTPGTFIFPSHSVHSAYHAPRPDTYGRIQAKSLSSVLIPLAKNAFPAQMNSLVTRVYTAMTILTFSIQQYLLKDLQKLRPIFQCQMTFLLLGFPVQETRGHLLTIKRHLGWRKRQKVVLTVMTR